MKSYIFIYFLILIHLLMDNAAMGFEGEQIVGGNFAEQYQFKYQVSLQLDGENLCGGGIMDDWHVITAAHCIFDFQTEVFTQQMVVIIANTLDEKNPHKFSVISRVKKIYIHRSYQNVITPVIRLVGDIAILRLKDSLKLAKDPTLKRLETFAYDVHLEGEIAIVAGYGYNVMTLSYSNNSVEPARIGSSDGRLRFARAVIMSNNNCNAAYGDIGIQDDNLCAQVLQRDPTSPEGTCAGDSGSPLVYRESYLVGIAIASPPNCQENIRPAVYTRISEYSDFIYNAMHDIITLDMIVAELTKISPFGSLYVQVTP